MKRCLTLAERIGRVWRRPSPKRQIGNREPAGRHDRQARASRDADAGEGRATDPEGWRDPFFEERPASSGSDHPHLDLADALDAALHDVAALDRADARGRARHDEVAGGKLEEA